MNLEQQFIDRLVREPVETYKRLRSEFPDKRSTFGQFEELWPVVEFLWSAINSRETINLCATDLALALQRKLVVQGLRHVSIRNRVVTPYVETVRAIEQAIAFFDVCVRYRALKKDAVELRSFLLEEENPRNRSLAYYHRYRYLYYYLWLVDKIPDVFIVPTTCSFTARDLMRFRCVPIFILGVATELFYVDEFEQTPIEFYMHDANHARRQYMANIAWMKRQDILTEADRVAWYERSAIFSKQLLDGLEIAPGDSEEARAMKNLKVMILFEIAHEDAEPLLPEVISESLQRLEGFKSRFEVPSIDPETGLMDVRDTIETGISTLSYVRHKLQNGFYDRINSTEEGPVHPRYRTTKHIARAAYELLRDIGVKPTGDTIVDARGCIAEEWLLDRACSYGPEIVHQSAIVDLDLEERVPDVREVNIKDYFKEDAGVAGAMRETLTKVDTKRPALAQTRMVADGIVFTIEDDRLKVLLIKRNFPPQADLYALPGGFLWEGERSEDCLRRVLRDKVGISGIHLEQLYTFDSPLRDPRGHIISTAYVGLVEYAALDRAFAQRQQPSGRSPALHEILFDIDELPELAFDHDQIITYGVARLRAKLRYSNVIATILPSSFTREQFLEAYAVILGDAQLAVKTLTHFVDIGAMVARGSGQYAFRAKEVTTFDDAATSVPDALS